MPSRPRWIVDHAVHHRRGRGARAACRGLAGRHRRRLVVATRLPCSTVPAGARPDRRACSTPTIGRGRRGRGRAVPAASGARAVVRDRDVESRAPRPRGSTPPSCGATLIGRRRRAWPPRRGPPSASTERDRGGDDREEPSSGSLTVPCRTRAPRSPACGESTGDPHSGGSRPAAAPLSNARPRAAPRLDACIRSPPPCRGWRRSPREPAMRRRRRGLRGGGPRDRAGRRARARRAARPAPSPTST